MFDDHEMSQGCFVFFLLRSKVMVLQKWEETLEKKKGIEKNEYEKKWIKGKETSKLKKNKSRKCELK
jgi:hypothetical protein